MSLSESRVSSSKTDSKTTPEDIFTPSVMTKIVEGRSDIFVVDGSQSSYDEKNDCPRLPRSMYGYLNWFLALNEAAGDDNSEYAKHLAVLRKTEGFVQLMRKLKLLNLQSPYAIRMYTPMEDYDLKKITIGDTQFPYMPFDLHDTSPQIILTNSVVDETKSRSLPKELRTRTPGFFDDPDGHLRQPRIAFTRFGLRTLKNGHIVYSDAENAEREKEYVGVVQEFMERSMEEMIRLAHPINRL